MDERKFDDAFEKAHGIEFDAFKFDEPDYDALQVTEENFLEMLRVQAAGIAYYGTLAKKCEAEYDKLERAFKARYTEMYDDCGSKIRLAREKDNVKNVESFINSKYQAELKDWYDKLDDLRAKRDSTAMYYEAWKSKGFALASMRDLVAAGLLKIRTSITEEDMDEMRSKRMKVDEAQSILDKHRLFLGK